MKITSVKTMLARPADIDEPLLADAEPRRPSCCGICCSIIDDCSKPGFLMRYLACVIILVMCVTSVQLYALSADMYQYPHCEPGNIHQVNCTLDPDYLQCSEGFASFSAAAQLCCGFPYVNLAACAPALVLVEYARATNNETVTFHDMHGNVTTEQCNDFASEYIEDFDQTVNAVQVMASIGSAFIVAVMSRKYCKWAEPLM